MGPAEQQFLDASRALTSAEVRARQRLTVLAEATSAAVWIREPDGSAVHDSPALRAITGQDVEDYRGWGFLDAVDPAHRNDVRGAWRRAIADGAEVVTCTYRLCTERGYRWFRTRAVPVRVAGVVVEWVGTDTDVDDEVRARQRLAVLARATSAVGAVHDPEEELTALAESVVPEFADICRVYLVDPVQPGAGPVTGRRSVTRTAEGVIPSPANDERFSFGPSHPIARCVRTGSSVLVPVPVPPEQAFYGPPEQHRWAERIGIRSMLVAPVVSRGVVVAALLFIACGRRPAFSEDDRALVVELAARASVAVEHAEHFQQTRQVSVALQAAMLTAPPTHPGSSCRPGTCRRRRTWRSAATGTTRSTCPTAIWRWGSATSRDTTSRPPPRWASCAACCGRWPTRPAADPRPRPRTSCGGWTAWRPGWTSPASPRCCSAGCAARPAAPCSAGPTPATRRRCWCRRTGSRCCCAAAWGWCWGWRRSGRGSTARWSSSRVRPCCSTPTGWSSVATTPHDTASTDLLDLVRRGKHLPLSDLCDHLVRGTTADTGDDMVVLALRVPS